MNNGDLTVRNVTLPTITPYLPDPAKATGAAVIVAPGGAFVTLAIKNEGSDVAQWLADNGVAAFVLKYRLRPTPADTRAYYELGQRFRRMAESRKPGDAVPPEMRVSAFQPAIDDGMAAVQLVRSRAAEFGIDPKRIGMVGFSAGAMNTLTVALANKPGAQPNFIGLIYGPMGTAQVPPNAPPLFAAVAADDRLISATGTQLLDDWRKAGAPVEFHLYQKGGHGFGMAKHGTTADLWPDEFLAWMRANNLLQAHAQAAGALDRPAPTPEEQAAMKRIMERLNSAPDTPGTGRFPALKEEVASLPDHTIYRPADLSRVPARSLPIIAWGNGGCVADGAFARFHLSELASHGYLVIANGAIMSGPGKPPLAPSIGIGTRPEQLVEAIDWAVRENGRPGSPLRGRLNTNAIAVSGTSCGGLQAMQIAASDKRVKTAVIHNSGIFPEGRQIPGMTISKSLLAQLHAPIIYILGGPTDVAYANGMDDYSRVSGVPVVVANDRSAGHNGTFIEDNGGRGAQVAVKWLDWQLKGDKRAADTFVGRNCALCRNPAWTIESKGF